MRNIPTSWCLRHHASLSSQCIVACFSVWGASDKLSVVSFWILSGFGCHFKAFESYYHFLHFFVCFLLSSQCLNQSMLFFWKMTGTTHATQIFREKYTITSKYNFCCLRSSIRATYLTFFFFHRMNVLINWTPCYYFLFTHPFQLMI